MDPSFHAARRGREHDRNREALPAPFRKQSLPANADGDRRYGPRRQIGGNGPLQIQSDHEKPIEEKQQKHEKEHVLLSAIEFPEPDQPNHGGLGRKVQEKHRSETKQGLLQRLTPDEHHVIPEKEPGLLLRRDLKSCLSLPPCCNGERQ